MSIAPERKDVEGQSRTVSDLLRSRRYTIDYYQRDYKWQSKQVAELLHDLTAQFQESHEEGNEREQVATYRYYFLGSVIISDREGLKYIVDGQQRLTTLTLLLIFLYHALEDAGQKSQVGELIYSLKFGRLSFNLDVEERTPCMQALFKGQRHDDPAPPESVANILDRYADIEELFPQELLGEALPYFVDWLIDRVQLIEITAYSDEDAYTIFETMNDRGLSLTPADMLKGYLLANITDGTARTRAGGRWKERTAALLEIGREEDADAIKAWLRSQHANTIRERKRNAAPGDFDRIGTEFHRWVRENEENLGLLGSAQFAAFIERDFTFYSHWYERLREAAENPTPGLECVHYNAQHSFTLQYPALLAPLSADDDEPTALRKLRVVAAWIDILINRRIWNWRAIDYSTMQYAMFQAMLDIRAKAPEELADLLTQRLDEDRQTFAGSDRFSLNKMNGPQVHRLLARMTDWVEVQAGRAARYAEYARRGGKEGYEIEHIWADHPERHADEFSHPTEFAEYRNRIGGLLLLPKSFNASYGDKLYPDKLGHYFGQNLLARSLCADAYAHDPGFARLRARHGLAFRAHAEFKKADLDARQALYQDLAERVWSRDRLAAEAAG